MLSTNAVFGPASQTTTASTGTTKTTTTTQTTTAATTTAASTSTATTNTTTAANQTPLEAQLVAVNSARSKLGAREVEVELSTNETTSAALGLTRGRTTPARRVARGVHAGDRVFTLIVPQIVRKGRAILHVSVSGGRSGHKAFQVAVAIPRGA